MTTGRRRKAQIPAPDVDRLGRDFARHRTAAQRAWRRYQAEAEAADMGRASKSHRCWSNAIENALAAAEALSRERPGSINNLIVQFEAIWWWIKEDDTVLDRSTRRWLMRFRRSLRRLDT